MTRCARCLDRPTLCLRCAALYVDESAATFRRNLKAPGGPAYLQGTHGPKRFRPADLDSYIQRKTKRRSASRGRLLPTDVERTRRQAWASAEGANR